MPSVPKGKASDARETDSGGANALVAPRTPQEIARRASAGEDHPPAAWREASRARALESFQLVSVRRAPRGAAVVGVRERLWEWPSAELARQASEHPAGRVGGPWWIVDREGGGAFENTAIDRAHAGFFDAPPGSR